PQLSGGATAAAPCRIFRTRADHYHAAPRTPGTQNGVGFEVPSSPRARRRREAKSMPPDLISPGSPGPGELVFWDNGVPCAESSEPSPAAKSCPFSRKG